LRAIARASPWVSSLECGDGITTQVSCSGPTASAASSATSAESIPPDSPTTTRAKPFLRT
jgi:hypothetical protein